MRCQLNNGDNKSHVLLHSDSFQMYQEQCEIVIQKK